jgi:hypothetical protein
VIKAMFAIVSAAAATLAGYAAGRLGVRRAGQALVVLGSVVFLILPSYAPYKPMAFTAQVGAMAAMAAWLRASDERRAGILLLLAGTGVGISVASKHTVGALTLAACLVVVWLVPAGSAAIRARLRESALVIAPAIAIPALTLVPILLAGDLDVFWRYAITKGEYVDRGSISYLDYFKGVWDNLGLPPSDLRLFLPTLGNLAAPLAVLGLVATIRRSGEWLLLASFTVAVIASSYPRPDLLIAVPVLSVSIAWSVRQLAARRFPALPSRIALGLVALILVATGYETLVRPIYIDKREGYGIGGIENHGGIPAPPEMRLAAGEVGGELAAVDAGENGTFVLSPYAGFIYLVSDTHDPTRQDYPYASTFRGGERAEIERRIASGELARVCLGSYKGAGRLRPAALESYVRSRMIRAERVGPSFDAAFGYLGCTIYRSPAGN